jgi:phosphoribosylanthranilate isomerase
MNIKVCGITTLKQLQQLEGLDIDFAGLNFYPASKRFVGDKIDPISLADADMDIKTVGIFVNQTYDEIIDAVERFGLDIVQLHGDETPELCESLSEDTEVIKVFRLPANVEGPIDDLLADYDEVCDYYLFDTEEGGNFGGTGKSFNWDAIANSKIEKPFFLSGGIGPNDAAKLKKFKHPDFYGVDINSLFEKEPGVKDMGMVLQFIHALK